MPTPDIDNLPEQIEVTDTLPASEQVPNPTPDQSAEILTSGTENPQPQIEQKTTNLVEVLNRLQNLNVETFFAANPTDDSAIAEQRAYFKDGLTIDTEADNIGTSHVKLYAMNTFIGISDDSIAKVYGVPIGDYGEKVRFKPQITLKFRELEINQSDTPVRSYKLLKEVSFRLLGDNIPNSAEELSQLREKILDQFADYSFDVSATETYTYRDLNNGYRLAIDCNRDTFIEITSKCLSIQDLNYDEQFLAVGNVARPSTPPMATVLGQQKTLNFRGRYGKVYFYRAEYKQSGIEDRIIASNIASI
jgi:hypothetical protein